ncbi:MMPL family transporter, partial [Streptomyces sp. NPDC056485]|uniref:MMPL family transporter n=1 Tax=Streptomyces sp. NPDC056485 TaxID=3345834 RepID=UPI0036CFF226
MSRAQTGRPPRPAPAAKDGVRGGPGSPRRTAWLVLLLTVIGLAAAFTLGPGDATTTEATGTSLPATAQSARAAEALSSFPEGAVAPAIVVYSNEDGAPLGEAQQRLITERSARLGALGLLPQAARPQWVDRRVATVAVLLPTGAGDSENSATVDQIRRTASDGLAAPLRAQVTGGPAFRADIAKVFDGADGNLLLATASV